MTELDPEVRELLDRWAAIPATPVSELTPEAVRKDDLAVLDLQRAPGELYSIEDVEAPGPAGALPVRVYRPRPERLHPVLFLHGGGFVIGRRRTTGWKATSLAALARVVSGPCAV